MTVLLAAPNTEQLSGLLAELQVARLHGESAIGLELASRAEELLAGHLIGELSAVLDAHIGALETNVGRLEAAASRLAHGAQGPVTGEAHRAALVDCAGQLALIEAYRGNLELAARYAGTAHEDAVEGSTGGEAVLLADVWLHLERGHATRARELYDRLPHALPGAREPWLVTAGVIAEARLLTYEGRPDAALCRLAAASTSGDGAWLDDLLTTASAEALLAAGEPQHALARLTPVPAHTAAEADVLTAIGRRDIGDLRGAGAGLAAASAGLAASPLGVQVQAWVLEARLAQEDGRPGRARLLVARALRAAAAEGLRRPLTNDKFWLRTFVERDPMLKREHRTFVSSLHADAGAVPAPQAAPVQPRTPLIETLTQRETEVLALLAEMYSTEEIADELFLSVNTVKTHIKGIFRKLDVNRRNSAVRRGRELGLC
jgi:LuxR family maltose regulon positive regulatory protein